ncbi:MAG: transketolase [Candidatus Brocadia sp.]|nr:transketolase [Candidatus Brocadia sp.]
MDKIKENVFEDAITTAFKPSIKSNRKFLAPQTGISESKKTLSDGHLCKKANQIRKDIVEVAIRNGAGHIAPSLSCVDILTALYYRIMNISRYPQWEERDRLIFSKAHGCYGLYAILADIGYIKREDWENFYKGSFLSGCVERSLENGIEASCGSLGHGLPIAVGIAFGAKLQNKSYRVYCIVGDGEMQEGSNWEAVQFAVKHKLSNLTVIIDNNTLQAMDFLENVLTLEGRKDDLQRKMQAFGFEAITCNGHNIQDIVSTLEKWKEGAKDISPPQVLIANTIKGYGLLCMESVPKFHFRIPTEEELKMGNRYE